MLQQRASTRPHHGEEPQKRDDLIDQLTSACSELRNPLLHNNVEELIPRTTLIHTMAKERGFQELQHAAACTLQKLREYENNLPKFQYAVNMYERSRWISQELRVALREAACTDALRVQRQDLTCNPHEPYELCGLNRKQWDVARKNQRVGQFRRQLRDVRYAIAEFSPITTPEPLKELSAPSLREFSRALWMPIHLMRSSLAAAENETSKKPVLQSLLGEVENRLSTPTGSVLTDLNRLMTQLEIESRVAFASDLGSKIPEGAQRQVSMHECVGAADRNVLEGVTAMTREWVINREDKRPQYGFIREYPVDELSEYLTTNRGRLFRADVNGRDVGYYLLFTESGYFPSGVTSMIGEVGEQAGEYLRVVQAWVSLVGVTKAGREWAHQNKIDLYTIIHEAVVDTLSSFQTEKAFAVVREGDFANLAMEAHLKRGWRPTGVSIPRGKFHDPYQIIRLDLSPGGNW